MITVPINASLPQDVPGLVQPAGGREPGTLRVLGLLLAFPLFFSVGRYVPSTKWTLELGIVLSLGLAILSATSGRPRDRDRFNAYILLVAFGLPVLGAFGAYLVFDQPMWLGLATQRGCLLALFAYAMANFLHDERLTLEEVRRALVILAWLNLAICAPVLIFFDPNGYADLGALVSDGGGVFNQWQLPFPFIAFGAVHFVSSWIVTGRSSHGLLALPFLFYVFAGNNGRISALAIIAALFTVGWIGSPHRRLSNMLGAIALIAIIAVAINVAFPEKISNTVAKFQDAFSAVSGAYNVEDISANARILEAEIAWPYVLSEPLIGTGTISNEWNGGYKRMFGYFHPSDLGLLGLMFVYGLVGVLFFAVQYVILLRLIGPASQLVSVVGQGELLLGIVGFLIFMLTASVATGSFILVPEQTLLPFVLLRTQAWHYSYKKHTD